MIHTRGLVKKYDRITAVDGIDLSIQPGEIYGFLGPNGAGKTSTIKMLLGLVKPTSGEISLLGTAFDSTKTELRRRIGVVPEKHPVGMWTWMTGKEYLRFFADLYEVDNSGPRIDHLLERIALAEHQHRKISGYSRGMLQKLSIVRALLHNPDILFLDEPISGLDPIGIKQIRDLIVEENREGRALFISSHLLSEMEKICHRVGIIHNGRLIAEDSMSNLLENLVVERKVIVELEDVPADLVERLKMLPYVRSVSLDKRTLFLSVAKEGEPRKALSRFLVESGLVPVRIEEEGASLEDAFVAITSENIDLLTTKGGEK